MAILENRTFELFGYLASTVTPGMRKQIAAQCERCSVEFTCYRKNLNEHCYCRKCMFASVPRENYARGVVARKKTCVKRYGAPSKAVAPEAAVRRAQTNVQRYGAPHPMQSAEIKEKAKNTTLERYGVPYVVMATTVREKSRKTMRERYGVEHTLQSPVLKEKHAQTCLKNHGVRNPFEHPVLWQKARESFVKTCQEKYGGAQPKYGQAESALAALLEQWTSHDVLRGHTLSNGLQVDLLIPSLALGIEYCGLHWHNEQSPHPRERLYHRNKQEAAKRDGLRLLTIFEDEWLQHRAAVENRLKSILGVHTVRLGARQCGVTEMPPAEAQEFCAMHHLQGAGSHPVKAWKLTHADQTVGCLVLARHHRHGFDSAVVLSRLVFRTDTSVAGGASRLWSAASRWARDAGYASVISWSDDRWSEGAIYEKLRFTMEAALPPDFTYVVTACPRKRISKQSQKQTFTTRAPGVTLRDAEIEKGFSRVWDCGHKRWVYPLNPSTKATRP